MSIFEFAERFIGIEPEKGFVFSRCAENGFDHVVAGRDPNLLTDLAVRTWIRETTTGRRSKKEVLINYFGERPWVNIFQYFKEAIFIAGSLFQGDAMANGLRVALLADDRNSFVASEYGKFLHEAYNDPATPHPHEHDRRKERWGEAGVFGIRELRHGILSIFNWVRSFQLDHYWHDADQMIWEHWNGLNPDQKVSPKEGHEEMIVMMLWPLRKRYQFESQLNHHDAERTIAGTIFMDFDHGEPETILDRLQAEGDAAVYDFDPEKLIIIIDSDGLPAVWQEMNSLGGQLAQIKKLCELHGKSLINPQSLKLRQIYAIGLYKRLRAGFALADSRYGLLPLYEAEYGGKILETLRENRNLGEILELQAHSSDWQSLCLAKEMNVRADVLEMKSHYIYSLLRTWSVERAKTRPWWRQEMADKIYQMVMDPRVGGNASKNQDNDVFRMLWEIMNEKMGDNTIIGRSRFNRRAEKETGILKLLVIKEFGNKIMKGDLSEISKAYARRRNQVSYKALKTAGFDPLILNLFLAVGGWLSKVKGQVVGDKFITDLLITKGVRVDRYSIKITSLMKEEKDILNNFIQKLDGADGLKIYPEEEIKSFNLLIDQCIGEFCHRHHISKTFLLRYKFLVGRRVESQVAPFQFYDSLGGGNIRTWMEPNPVVKAKLHQIIFKTD